MSSRTVDIDPSEAESDPPGGGEPRRRAARRSRRGRRHRARHGNNKQDRLIKEDHPEPGRLVARRRWLRNRGSVGENRRLDDALVAYLDQGQDTDAPDDAFIGALWRLHVDIDGLNYAAKRLELLLPALDRWGRDIESLRLLRHSMDRSLRQRLDA